MDNYQQRAVPASSRYTPPRQAVENEAVGGTQGGTPIDWGGVTLHVPDPDDLDIDVIEAFENGRAVGSMREIFGANEFARARRQFEDRNGTRPKVRDLNQLADLVFEVWGLDRGE